MEGEQKTPIGLGEKAKELMAEEGSEGEEEALVLVGTGEEGDSKPNARITSSPACRCSSSGTSHRRCSVAVAGR